MAEPSSLCRRLSEIVGDDLLSFLSFRFAGGGMRAVTGYLKWLSMTRVLRPRLLGSGQHVRTRERIVRVADLRVSHAPWGDPDRELTCHVSHGRVLCGIATWASGGDPYSGLERDRNFSEYPCLWLLYLKRLQHPFPSWGIALPKGLSPQRSLHHLPSSRNILLS